MASFVIFNKIYPSCRAKIALLKVDKSVITVFLQYSEFTNVFSPKLAPKLPKHAEINNHIINLVHYKQPSYKLIHNAGPVILEILQTYIKTNLANAFIKLLKSSLSALVFFFGKFDNNVCPYVD